MFIRILVIFLITFIPINATPCKDNPTCECSSTNSDDLTILCDVNNSTEYTVNIKTRNNVEIVCKNWKTWEDFYIKGRLSEKILQSLSFEKCGLLDNVNLKNIVRQLGVRETKTLIFRSFRNLFERLKRKHLQGFKKVKKLVLSDNGLTTISNDMFIDFPELEYIDLSNNNIDLPVDIFKETPNLRQIFLASSEIDRIHARTFNNLTNLKTLNIMSNYLEEIEEGTFDHLVSLTSLNLAMNLIRIVPMSIFHGLKNLQELDISMNYFYSIPNLFHQNKELRVLYLHNNINRIYSLPDNLLANMTKLQYVHLNNNGFIFLLENLFWGSSSLEIILLNDNSLFTLPKNIFRGLTKVRKLLLQNNKIQTLPDNIFQDMEELGILDLSNNQMVNLTGNLFVGLVSLYELNMERNKLKTIHKAGLAPLINLSIARFSHNPLNLTSVNRRFSVFSPNEYLEELYLSNCSIFDFFDVWSSGNNNLRILDLSYNFITSVTMTSFILPSRQIKIDLSYNKIKNIHFDQIEEMVSSLKGNRYIVIHLEHNPLLCDCTLYDLLRFRENKMYPSVYKYFNLVMGNSTCTQSDGTNEREISKLNSSTYACLEHEYFKAERKCQDNCICYIRPSDNTFIADCMSKPV